jgi:hypothetical protein
MIVNDLRPLSGATGRESLDVKGVTHAIQ